MMKTIKPLFFSIVLIFLSVTVVLGQKESEIPDFPIDRSSGKITYQEIVIEDSASKDELFTRAKICFIHLFKSPMDVIQEEDKEAGLIIGKGTIKVIIRSLGMIYEGGYVHFTLTIVTKDERYKYTITDFVHEGIYSMPSGGDLSYIKPTRKWTRRWWDSVLLQTDDKTKDAITFLKSEMKKPSPQNNAW